MLLWLLLMYAVYIGMEAVNTKWNSALTDIHWGILYISLAVLAPTVFCAVWKKGRRGSQPSNNCTMLLLTFILLQLRMQEIVPIDSITEQNAPTQTGTPFTDHCLVTN